MLAPPPPHTRVATTKGSLAISARQRVRFLKPLFLSDQSLCSAMRDCAKREAGDCADCLSGQRGCSKLNDDCMLKGMCQGKLIDSVKFPSHELEHN